jgi:hypothetical protein
MSFKQVDSSPSNVYYRFLILTIMIVRFVDRKDELSTLNMLFKSGKAHLVVVYGRRRVGCTPGL